MSTALDISGNTCNYTVTVFHCDHYNIDIRPDVCIERQSNGKTISKSRQPKQIHPFLHCLSCEQGKLVAGKKIKTFQKIYENVPVIEMKQSEFNKFFVIKGSDYEEKEHKALVNNYQTLKFKDGMLGEKKKKEKKPVNDIKKAEKNIAIIEENTQLNTNSGDDIDASTECVDVETETHECITETQPAAECAARIFSYEDTRFDENNILNKLNIKDIHPGGHLEFSDPVSGERLYMCDVCLMSNLKKEEMVECQRSKRFPDGVKNICIQCNSNKDTEKISESKYIPSGFAYNQPKNNESIQVDFSKNIDMLKSIEGMAHKEFRTVNQQILYILSKTLN